MADPRSAPKDYSSTPLSRKLGAKPGVEVLVLFTTSRAELEADGLWVAYPKKTAGIATDLDFDAVQSTGLAAGLVDNKICAIDESWTAMRFVYRLADR